LYEAKLIHHFDHRWATYDDGQSSRDATTAEKQDPSFEVTPRYWVPTNEVLARLERAGWPHKWLIAWRDITNATNERTVIASVFPLSGSGDTLLLMFPGTKHVKLAPCLLANLTSLVLDYCSRQKVGGTHLKFNTFFQLPVLPPTHY